jgi:hypothetical protein
MEQSIKNYMEEACNVESIDEFKEKYRNSSELTIQIFVAPIYKSISINMMGIDFYC